MTLESLRPARPLDAETITGWSRSPEESTRWCSAKRHPVPSEQIVGWWDDPDVQPWVMLDPEGDLLGYGELWLDTDEDEVELARLIIPPEARGRGVGQRLVRALVAAAATTGLATTFLRVKPDNVPAIRSYLASGFERLGPEEAAEWGAGQLEEYVWMRFPRPVSS